MLAEDAIGELQPPVLATEVGKLDPHRRFVSGTNNERPYVHHLLPDLDVGLGTT